MTADQSSEERRIEDLADAPQIGLAREFLLFLRDNHKWWLMPILIVLIGATVLVALTASGAGPWIYTMF